MIRIYDIHGDLRAEVEVNEGSAYRYELMKEEKVTLRFSLVEPIVFQIGDYVEFWGEDYPYLRELGKFVVTDEYKPGFSANTQSYNYDLELHSQYWLWRNKIIKYVPEYGGQECSWVLTAKPSEFLQVIISNLDHYGFQYEDSEGGHDYTFSINNRIYGDGMFLDYDAKAVTLSFSNSSIIDALNSIAQQLDCDWWVNRNVIWLGRCENFRGEYVMEDGHEVQRTDKEGNPVYRKDEEGNDIMVDGHRIPVYEPYSKPISLDFFGDAIPPNAESCSTGGGSEQFANRIFVFGGERNIPTYYRKKLVFHADYDADEYTYEGEDVNAYYDDVKKLDVFKYHSDTHHYPDGVQRSFPSESDTVTYRHGETVTHKVSRTGTAAYPLYYGVSGVESAGLRLQLLANGIVSPKVKVSVCYKNGEEDVEAQSVTVELVRGSTETKDGKEYTRYESTGLEELEVRRVSDSGIRFDAFIRYTFTFQAEEGDDSTQKAYMSVEDADYVFYNRNPRVATTAQVTIDGVTETYQVHVNLNHMPYYFIGAMGWAFRKGGVWLHHICNFEFTLSNVILGKVERSYFDNDARNEVAVNGIVQKRLMLPMDMNSAIFDDVRDNPKYDGYFSDQSKLTGKGHIDSEEGLDTREIVEMVVIDDSIYPNQEDTLFGEQEDGLPAENYEIEAVTDVEKDEDGNETTKYYYDVTGPVFGNFTKDYLTSQTLQITFGANQYKDDQGRPVGGKLNGMTFDAELKRRGGVSYFRIVPNDNYAVTLPNDSFRPAKGDRFALVNYDPSFVGDTMTYEAERKLLKSGYKTIEDMARDKKTYTFSLMSDSSKEMIESGGFFRVGDMVTMFGQSLFGSDGQQTRVTAVEVKLDLPYDTPTVTCGQSSSYSRLSALEGKIDELQYNGSTYSSAGSSGGMDLYVITTGDSTQPSNYNLMSAARTMAEIGDAVNGAREDSDSRYLRKDIEDEAAGKITFEKGAEFGEFARDSSGAAVYEDEDGNWHIETDHLMVRKKLAAKEVVIEKERHIGGSLILSAASAHIDHVRDMTDRYRCYFRREDGQGRVIYNEWQTGDQALVQTFNLARQEDGTMGNHYLWRLVIGLGTGSGTAEVDGQTLNLSDFHYIDLSKSDRAADSDAPMAGDDMVQLGYRPDDDPARRSAIVIKGAGEGSPYIYEYTGISSYSLPTPDTRLAPGDNLLTGKVVMTSGSKLEDGREIDKLGTEEGNLLLNSGFTGGYQSEETTTTTKVEAGTQMFSDNLKHWECENVYAEPSGQTASRYWAALEEGSLSQDIGNVEGGWYRLSMKAQGTLTISFRGVVQAIGHDTFTRADLAFNISSGAATLTISGSGKVGDVMLTKGTIGREWLPSEKDGDKALASMLGYEYLQDAIQDASTKILGGLVLTQLIKVGNYRNNSMTVETGGMSGLYNSEKSPFLWGGGSLEQAFYTIGKYAQNPAYQATEEEVAQMAKFVVTHGGRAILNDIVLRGYIYALGGVFKNVRSPDGNWIIDEEGNVTIKKIDAEEGKIGGFTIEDKSLSVNSAVSDMATSMSIYHNMVSFISSNTMFQALIGIISSIGDFCLGRFQNTRNDYLPNLGLVFDIENGTYNFAFSGKGSGLLDGWVDGYAFRNVTLEADTLYEINAQVSKYVVFCTTSNSGVIPPKYRTMQSILRTDGNFAVRLTIIADFNNTKSFKVYGRGVNSNHNDYNWALMLDNTNTRITGGISLAKGESIDVMLIYDSEHEEYNSYYGTYIMKILNINQPTT